MFLPYHLFARILLLQQITPPPLGDVTLYGILKYINKLAYIGGKYTKRAIDIQVTLDT